MTFITMSVKELGRFQSIKKLIGRHLPEKIAARLLRLFVRHIRRLKTNVKQFGAKGLMHGNRGHVSCHRLDRNEKKRLRNCCVNTTRISNQPSPARSYRKTTVLIMTPKPSARL